MTRDPANRIPDGSDELRAVPVESQRNADFGVVHQRMLDIARDIRDADSPGRVLIVEHEPVYTAGRATPAAALAGPPPTADSAPPIPIVPIERGGQITYHGPGQLVVYPIVPLPRRDARAWLRALERFGIAVCARFGLGATASDDGTGVFVAGRKVGSIGVALRHWINLHGIALNIAMDLEPFHRVRPCGLDPQIMSDLSRAAGRPCDWPEARDAAIACLPELGLRPAEDRQRPSGCGSPPPLP